MITAESILFSSTPRITAESFVRAVTVLAADAVTQERAPLEYYNAIIAQNTDPLAVLAIFEHESTCGRYGVAAITKSWGNMRNPPVGTIPYHLYNDPSKGTYLSFATWLDGCAATAAHGASSLYRGLSVTTTLGKWAPVGDGANDPNAYINDVVAFMNQWQNIAEPEKTMRFVIHAGHVNIGAITTDPNGSINADALRGETGANGEMKWNRAMASALGSLLANAGADVHVTDAIYHPDIYGVDADMVYAVHYDGSGGSGGPQYCMAATVHSGPSTSDVDSRADAFVADWYKIYPSTMGIPGDGPITTDMTEYYGGFYRTANTPMVLGEHCLGADASGIRADCPSPDAAALGVFHVFTDFFNLVTNPQPPQQASFYQSGSKIPIKPPFWNRFNALQQIKDGLGFAEMGYAVAPETTDANGNRIQRFERGWYKADANASDPWDCVAMLLSEYPSVVNR